MAGLPPHSAPPGDTLAHFRIERELGRGAQGVVYLARDEHLDRRVALKCIRPDAFGTDEQVARFRREAAAAARITHPHVCTVYEAGIHEGTPWIAMAWIDGPSLAAWMDEHPPRGARDREERLRLVEQVARGLDAAHRAGLVHRDVKPGNILLTPEGTPVLMDFGLARPLTPAPSSVTRTGDLRGTPAYMAPEQIRGQAVDARTDVHALGVLAYELLVGHRPYEGATWHDLFREIVETPPLRSAALPRDVWIVLETALAKDPDRRYGSARDLAEDLRRVREHKPIRARPAGPLLRLRRWARRRPAVALGLLLTFGALVAIAIQQATASQRLRQEVRATREAREEADRRAYLANIRAADASLANHDAAEARRRLQDCPPQWRGWEWRYLDNALDASAGQVAAHDQEILVLAQAPDGRTLLSADDAGALHLWSLPTLERLATLEAAHGRASIHGAAFSPDGTRFATGGADGALVIWTREGEVQRRIPADQARARCVAWTPDGRTLISGHEAGRIFLFDADSGERRGQVEAQPGTVRTLVLDVSGTGVWFGTNLGHIRHLDLATQRVTPLAKVGAQVWSCQREGDALLVGLSDGTVRLLDLPSGTERQRFIGHRRRVTAVAFLDDARVASGSLDGSVRIWDRASASPRRVLSGHTGSVRALTWVAGDHALISGGDDGTLRRWRDGPSPARLRSTEGVGVARTIAFHPTRPEVALSGGGGWIYIHDTHLGDLVRIVRTHHAHVRDLAFSPTGETLVSVATDGAWRSGDAAGEHPARVVHAGGPLAALARSPDGRTVATGGSEGSVRLWDAASGALRDILARSHVPIRVLAFDPDGERMLVVRRGRTDIHACKDGTPLCSIPRGQDDAAWSPDGSRVAIADGTTVTIHEAATGGILQTLEGHDQRITAVDWHPDGTRLATGSLDQTVRLWDPDHGSTVSVLRESTSWIRVVAFSPDGQALVAAASDRSLVIWRAGRSPEHSALVLEQIQARRAVTPWVDDLRADLPRHTARLEAVAGAERLSSADRRAARILLEARAHRPRLDPVRDRLTQVLMAREPTAAQRETLRSDLLDGVPEMRLGWTWKPQRALAWIRLGTPEKALPLLHVHARSSLRPGYGVPTPFTRMVLALAHLRLGDRDQARMWLRHAERRRKAIGEGPRQLTDALMAEVREALE